MSAITIIPVIKAIRSILAHPAVVSTPLDSLAAHLRRAAAPFVDEPRVAEQTLLPVSVVREAYTRKRESVYQALAADGLPAADAARVATMVAVNSTGLAGRSDALHAATSALAGAVTPVDLERAEVALVQAVEEEHAACFANALTATCTASASALGFESESVVTTKGVTKIVATDGSGRSLITVVHAGANETPRLETEVVGVSDGSCQRILDQFDAELAKRGVDGAPPERKTTGGLCMLEAAREFVTKKLKKSPTQPHTNRRSARRTQAQNAVTRATNGRGG
jgi:hypothetical protein